MMAKAQSGCYGWHFLSEDRLLKYGDGRYVRDGETLMMVGDGRPVLCCDGMHASDSIVEAHAYNAGSVLCRVWVEGDIVRGVDKFVGRRRTVIWSAMIDKAVWVSYAKWCADRANGHAARAAAVATAYADARAAADAARAAADAAVRAARYAAAAAADATAYAAYAAAAAANAAAAAAADATAYAAYAANAAANAAAADAAAEREAQEAWLINYLGLADVLADESAAA